MTNHKSASLVIVSRWLLILTIATIVTACGAQTVKKLQTKPAGHLSFIAPMSYEKAYRLSYLMMRDCYEANLLTGGFTVKGVIFPDIKQAEITASLPDLLGGLGYYFMTTIESIDNGNAKITTYHAHDAHSYVGYDLKRWLLKGEMEC